MVPERPMQCSKTTTGCPVMPLTATCISVAMRTRFQLATTFMLVHRASPRNQMRCTTTSPSPPAVAWRPLRGLPSQAHTWLAFTMPSVCPARRFSGPDAAGSGPAGISAHELAVEVTPRAVMSRVDSRTTGRVDSRTHREYSNAVNTALLYSVARQNPAGAGYRSAADAAIMLG